MSTPTWEFVQNMPCMPLEFGANHPNYAWRKHPKNMRFGVLKSSQQLFASDSLARAFGPGDDSIHLLFAGRNRVMTKKPDYGQAKFVAVWYEHQTWAILCNPHDAIVISSSLVSELKRQRPGATQVHEYLQQIWDSNPQAERVPLRQVVTRIA